MVPNWSPTHHWMATHLWVQMNLWAIFKKYPQIEVGKGNEWQSDLGEDEELGMITLYVVRLYKFSELI